MYVVTFNDGKGYECTLGQNNISSFVIIKLSNIVDVNDIMFFIDCQDTQVIGYVKFYDSDEYDVFFLQNVRLYIHESTKSIYVFYSSKIPT